MHFAFIAYGARQEVERLMRDIESQKFQLKLSKKGEMDKAEWVIGQVRELPFGVKEIIFPKEYLNLVLATMTANTAPNRLSYNRSKAYKLVQTGFRKALGLRKLPKDYDKSVKLLWAIEYVSIIPIGLRDDAQLEEMKSGEYNGWVHEAL